MGGRRGRGGGGGGGGGWGGGRLRHRPMAALYFTT